MDAGADINSGNKHVSGLSVSSQSTLKGSTLNMSGLNISNFPMSLIIDANESIKIKLTIDREIIDNAVVNLDDNDRKNEDQYKLGDLVCLTKNRRGLIRYIGEVDYDSGKFYGIELLGESSGRGYHNGTVHSKEYFKVIYINIYINIFFLVIYG